MMWAWVGIEYGDPLCDSHYEEITYGGKSEQAGAVIPVSPSPSGPEGTLKLYDPERTKEGSVSGTSDGSNLNKRA